MTQTEAPTTTYRVTLADGGTLVVQASGKTAAGEVAIDRAVAGAKAYNAKYASSLIGNGVAWGLQDENRSAYAVRSIRKAPARR